MFSIVVTSMTNCTYFDYLCYSALSSDLLLSILLLPIAFHMVEINKLGFVCIHFGNL